MLLDTDRGITIPLGAINIVLGFLQNRSKLALACVLVVQSQTCTTTITSSLKRLDGRRQIWYRELLLLGIHGEFLCRFHNEQLAFERRCSYFFATEPFSSECGWFTWSKGPGFKTASTVILTYAIVAQPCALERLDRNTRKDSAHCGTVDPFVSLGTSGVGSFNLASMALRWTWKLDITWYLMFAGVIARPILL